MVITNLGKSLINLLDFHFLNLFKPNNKKIKQNNLIINTIIIE